MENRERDIDRLARYIIILAGILFVGFIGWYFRSVLAYIVLSAVVALIAHPLFKIFMKLKVKGRHIPDWLAAGVSLVCVFVIGFGIMTTIYPVISSVIGDISTANINNMGQAMSIPLENLNLSLIKTFPGLGMDFRIEEVVLGELQGLASMGSLSSMVGSVAGIIASIFVGIFAVMFISFFFIKNPGMITNIILAVVPDRYEAQAKATLGEIATLISRYFVGLILEILGVSVINFLGLLLVAQMGFRYSIGIAFMTGILNVIPYLGPLIGGTIGIALSLTIRYVCASSFGLAVGFPAFVAVLIGIFVFTQLVDNYLFQPFIYSNSVKAHPLEIFLVLLMVGHMAGVAGMLVAIPSYTVIRVIAKQFFGNIKPVKALTENHHKQ
ncbi:MAG: AI-2E family transporter [Bacteroidales bacterium]|nr:AI-2E family transporter [Bacteroidales bacterium]